MECRVNYFVFAVLVFLQACSGGENSTDELVGASSEYKSNVSDLPHISVNIPSNKLEVSIVDNPLYFELGLNSTVKDSQGNIHIFFGLKELRHRYFDGSEWQEEIIDNASMVGKNATVVLGNDGIFHILYGSSFNLAVKAGVPQLTSVSPNLKYAFGKTGDWTISTTPISSQGLEENRGTLALSNTGQLAFAYEHDDIVMLSRYNNGQWTTEEVADDMRPSAGLGFLTNIELIADSLGDFHIFYYRSHYQLDDNYGLIYVRKLNDIWVKEVVRHEYTGSTVAISAQLDAVGKVIVCYRIGDYPSRVECSRRVDGYWVELIIDSGNTVMYHPTLKVDVEGNMHVAYYINKDGGVYLGYSTNSSGLWVHSSYEIASGNDTPPNLEILEDGNIAIYFKLSDSFRAGKLIEIFWDGKNWSETVIYESLENDAKAGRASSIAISHENEPVIAYLTSPSSGEYFAIAESSNTEWLKQMPFPEYRQFNASYSGTPLPPVLKYDNNGGLHAIMSADSYYYKAGVFYATDMYGEWVLERLSGEYNASAIDMFIDKSNAIHIAYLSQGDKGRKIDWRIRYATNRTGEWVEETIHIFPESDGLNDTDKMSVAVHVSDEGVATVVAHKPFYLSEPLRGLIQAKQVENSWEVSSLMELNSVQPEFMFFLSNGWVAWDYPSIVFDVNGKLHMSYNASECNSLTCYPIGIGYSTNSSGKWTHQIIDAETYYIRQHGWFKGEDPVLAVEGGDVYIAYYHHLYGHLRVAKVGSCDNMYLVIDDNISTINNSSVRSSLSVSMELSEKSIFLSYHDNPNGNLKYAKLEKTALLDECDQDNSQWFQSSKETANRTVIIANSSEHNQLVSSLRLYDVDHFSIVADTCLNTVLAPEGVCSIDIEFNPGDVGAYLLSLAVNLIDELTEELSALGVNVQANVFYE